MQHRILFTLLITLSGLYTFGEHNKPTTETTTTEGKYHQTDSAPYKLMFFNYKRSLDPRQYMVNQVEGRLHLGTFFSSIQYNHQVNGGVQENKLLRTIDIQFLGFSTPPLSKWGCAFSYGAFINLDVEERCGQITGKLFHNRPNGLSAWVEGKTTIAYGRSIATACLTYPVFRMTEYKINMLIFGSSASYWTPDRRIPVDVIGIGGSVDF